MTLFFPFHVYLMASDAACIDSRCREYVPICAVPRWRWSGRVRSVAADADSKEGMLVQILMRQSQTLFGGVFLRRACGFPGGTFQFAPMVGFSNQGLVRCGSSRHLRRCPRVSLRGAFLGLFAFLVGVDGQCGGEYAQSFYLHRASHSHFQGPGLRPARR